ncbi:hypothetical protein A2886_00460 [candidate division WWE3 bacterium RIFCSPHIGHO2_01_FULL_42_13]|uniref:Cation-transporting P-type ATPase N-terminal domain-containing protein n=1 Tax=candidate division WWE3 bacterium RIFCSPHIGHO2_01_FULL_42_13 TaxID=1802617 RepID=A0A1F4US08_UNCKA|nr:MAG: hypothetical protein A2886_00460 [candidate division WWE3 bacterium RIFCSPHIGHO2_01_FULL_42_13]
MPDERVETISSLAHLHQEGLTTTQAGILLKEHGPNNLPETPPPSSLTVFLSQLKSPLVYVLLAAGVVTLFLREYAETAIISLAVFVNTILGYVQERRAGKALEALKKLVQPQAKVIRDGQVVTVSTEQIVPGDVVLLNQGDKVPADGKLLEVNRFFVSEAILTGESEPVSKGKGGDVYMGTIVTAGKAKMVVTVTGARSEMGKIAGEISADGEETPLARQLRKFSNQLSVLVLGLVILVFAIGTALGENLVDIFTTSVALAVSAIPEGLLVGLTVVLAIGMQRILARKGLVRNLVSAETLGGVTTICIDKTGTLTEGKMQVVNVVGEENELAQQVTLANDLDTSAVIAAWEWGSKKVSQEEKEKFEIQQRLDSLPFSSDHKFSASLYPLDEHHNILFVTGAPDIILEYSLLGSHEVEEVKSRINELSHSGKRLLAFARKKVRHSMIELSKEDVQGNLEWVGMLAFSDPIREDVKAALEKTRAAGIKLMVITGDYAGTAKFVLKELGLEVKDGDVVLGPHLENMSPMELEHAIFGHSRAGGPSHTKLFARTRPHQKLKIVEILKAHGEVVAMMGDGVNDAPALSKADIGIVVGEASDVAKESADLVLLDSGFATIVAAIEEGRGIFDNVRKMILYLMSGAFVEIFLVLTSLVARLPVPISAVQILWINLVSDGFPHLALTVDPKASGIMNRHPRPSNERLISGWMLKLMIIVSGASWAFALVLFLISYKVSGDASFARSVAFVTVGLNSLAYVFSVRMLTDPFWKDGIFDNKWLVVAVIAGVLLQAFPFFTPGLRAFFRIEPIGVYWIYAAVSSLLMFFVMEIAKAVFTYKLHAGLKKS